MTTLPITTRLADSADTLRVASTKAALSLYRISALVILYLVLLGVFGYIFLLGFFAVNTSWVAPVVLSPMDDKGLELTEKLVTTRQSAEVLQLDITKLQDTISEMQAHKAALQALEPKVKVAIAREVRAGTVYGEELTSLGAQKRADNAKTQALLGQLNDVEATINKELSAGLITKGDAAVQTAQLNQVRHLYTDSRISEVMLRDGVLQKSAASTQTLDVLDKRVELQSQIAQLDISISLSERQMQAEREQLNRLNLALDVAAQTPYFMAVSQGTNQAVAFVPYDNQNAVSVGAQLYDCYASIVVCRRVGEVSAIYKSEERAQNPIFKTDMRGFLIQLKLDDPSSAKSKTLFLRRKPLLF